MPNLIKQYSGDIRPAPLPAPKPTQSTAEEETSKSPQKPSLTEQGQAVLDIAFEQAEEILSAAQERSSAQLKETMDKARQECESLRRQSREEGYSEGFEEGKKDGHEEGWQEGFTEGMQTAQDANAAILGELQTLLQTIEQQREAVLRQYEDNLCTLAVSIAKKILTRELELDKNSIRTILINALEGYRNQEWIRINVSPETAKDLLHTNGTIADALKQVSENVKVVPSPVMSNSDCVIEMPDQAIDAGVDAQLNKVEQTFTT